MISSFMMGPSVTRWYSRRRRSADPVTPPTDRSRCSIHSARDHRAVQCRLWPAGLRPDQSENCRSEGAAGDRADDEAHRGDHRCLPGVGELLGVEPEFVTSVHLQSVELGELVGHLLGQSVAQATFEVDTGQRRPPSGSRPRSTRRWPRAPQHAATPRAPEVSFTRRIVGLRVSSGSRRRGLAAGA